ncbi:UNVERIFIED_CONTAM: putative lipoprotein [Sesamum latifolium]|uniref:Lipoprotein n=1 Tax=Sesamum latifolium TaxID=2727402 RepID=A0AAW2UKA3_9LAMI
MTSLNLGRPFHSTAGRRLRLLPEKPASRLAISCSSSLLPNKFKRAYTSVMIVPTGVGAAIGGYAGDALPVARTLASVVDCLISHPNVLNAAMLYWPMPNVLYVEGYALDRFAEGLWALQPVHQNKVGLVLDAGIEEELRIRHLQVADATRASLGLPIVEYTVTDAALQVEKWIDPKSGQSTGRIQRPDSLLRAVETLVSRSGVNAIAVVARFPDDDTDDDVENYRQGKGVDLLAGVEAVISHLVVQKFGIPCAHAPALLPFSLSPLCPKSAAEEIGYTFLPCVLAGLSTAPQYLVQNFNSLGKDCILANDVDSVILPIDACGGDGALAFASRKTNRPLLIAVEENETVLSDTPEKLGIPTVKVSNYWEAIGVVAAHKAGVDPNSLRKNRIKNICGTSFIPSNGYAVTQENLFS